MQNSGNPVLDSLVNIVCSGKCPRHGDRCEPTLDDVKALHKTLMELVARGRDRTVTEWARLNSNQ